MAGNGQDEKAVKEKTGIASTSLLPRRETFYRSNSNLMLAPSPPTRSLVSPVSTSPTFDFQSSRLVTSTPRNDNVSAFQTAMTTGPLPMAAAPNEVGFSNIPNQLYRKAKKDGFEFSLMVVGQSGLGKSTFIRSLFLIDGDTIKASAASQQQLEEIMPAEGQKTLSIGESTIRLVENGVSLLLTLVDTPGFGDALDNSKCWEPIVEHVDAKFGDYYDEETKVGRKGRIPDKRVHCCLYFIAPTGHCLKPLDIEFMKRLHDRVNIIPVIAKADTMTDDERKSFKEKVAKDIKDNNIDIYQFPDGPEGQKKFTDCAPFAIIGSNAIINKGNGKLVRGRHYLWGTVEVENIKHNDFIALRQMIIQTHMVDLIGVTGAVHYENYRIHRMTSTGALANLEPAMMAMSLEELDNFSARDKEERMKKLETQHEKEFQEKFGAREARIYKMEQELARNEVEIGRELKERRRALEEKRSVFRQERDNFLDEHVPTTSGEHRKHLSVSALNNASFGSKGSGKSKSGTLSGVFRRKDGPH